MLGKLALRFSDLLNRRKKIESIRQGLLHRELRATRFVKEISFKLKSFAAYGHFESNGLVMLKHITSHHSQYARCVRAVNENIAPGFFEGSGFDTLNMLEAFKLENSLLLH